MPESFDQCWNVELETIAPDPLAKLEQDRLSRQLRYVWEASPFYRRKWEAAGTRSARPLDATCLARLPFTEKRELQEAQNDPPPFGCNQSVPMERLVRMQATGGTSGQP